jgi:WD40 repeat protein
VIIWSLQSNGPIQKLLHQDIVSSAVFTSQNLVASGCFDRVIRVWNVNQRKVIAWHDTKEFITALSYNKPVLVAGLVSGDIVVYSCEEFLKKQLKINCKNRTGIYAEGRKVTGIEFYDETVVCVTTNDSRIRFVNT